VRRSGEGWVAETEAGDMGVRVEVEARAGMLDFVVTPAPGVTVLTASRVIPRGVGSEYVFTQFQGPGMPDEVCAKRVQAVGHELKVLKALLEVECPL
jgi:hypothetical protein